MHGVQKIIMDTVPNIQLHYKIFHLRGVQKENSKLSFCLTFYGEAFFSCHFKARSLPYYILGRPEVHAKAFNAPPVTTRGKRSGESIVSPDRIAW